ncbi:MAG: response regulator transcription factor [Oligoflexia bacterium]|nr:response regulator transcription factor [Oligoflexia bacterium]
MDNFKKKILLVEDDPFIADIIQIHILKNESDLYETIWLTSGTEAKKYLEKLASASSASAIDNDDASSLAICILDIMLPGVFGLDICRFMRESEQLKHIPILMLTALATPEHIIAGLEAGADDYVTKPFDIHVLLARVRALLRRSKFLSNLENDKNTSSTINFSAIKIDLEQRRIWKSGEELYLTPSEFKLLTELIRSHGKVLTRTDLIKNIQGEEIFVTERTIDTHMVALRKKLQDMAIHLETVRGIGYRMTE